MRRSAGRKKCDAFGGSAMVNPLLEHEAAVSREVRNLADEFAGIFSVETVGRYVQASLDTLQGARVDSFIPLFVHRFARERLRALAQVQGRILTTMPEVLFVC